MSIGSPPPPAVMRPRNAFTVDVEDYFQVSAFESRVDRSTWDAYPQRVVGNTHRMLDLLAEHDVRATFYVLGWIADKYPHLVRRIAADGHELGSHSYWHRLVYGMTPGEFRADVRQSKTAIENAAGVQVDSYRAPSFSITRRSTWALPILVEEGFTSDSSIFPINHDRYGIPEAEPTVHKMRTRAGDLWEFPPSIMRWAGINVPVAGGGYFRLYPLSWTFRCLRQFSQTDKPFMFYVHPWEIDPDQPRLSPGCWISRFRHYVNLRTTHEKLRKLLTHFSFGRVGDVLEHVQRRELQLAGAV